MTDWFARPVLHVSNVETSLGFYVDRLGFTVPWRVEWDGHTRVSEVESPRLRADPLRRVAGEGRQGLDIHFPERRARHVVPGPVQLRLPPHRAVHHPLCHARGR